MNGAILRYRVMSYIVGVGLLLLVFVGIPLQYAAGKPAFAAIIGPIHGLLYIVYLAPAFDLARRAHFRFWRIAAMVGAGFIPFLAFIVEHQIMVRLKAEEAVGVAVARPAPDHVVD